MNHSVRSGKKCRTAVLAALALVVAAAGCGGGGIKKYSISGSVTQDGRPIRIGDIQFEPTEGTANRETIAVAEIRNGRYTAAVVGGPHRVAIRDLSGGDDSGTSELFAGQYFTNVDLPAAPPARFTQDFEVPADFK